MGKCTKCGCNFVGTAADIPADQLCKYCEIDQLRADKFKLRTALFNLVGADKFEELKPMLECLKIAPGDDADRQLCIDAIQVLLET